MPVLHIFGSEIGSKFRSVFVFVFGSVLASKRCSDSAQIAFNIALEGPRKRQKDFEDAMHRKI